MIIQAIFNYNLDILKTLIRTTTNLKFEIRDMATKIDRIAQIYNDQFPTDKINKFCDVETTWNFPLNTLQELDEFEKKLIDNSYKNKVVKINLIDYYSIDLQF